jgi:AraC-like DNA-binding protein
MDSDLISFHFIDAELASIGDAALRQTILQRAAIAPDCERVTPAQLCQVSHAVRELLQDELAGRGQGRLPPGFFVTLCKFAIHGDTLLKCLARAASFSNLFEGVSGVRVVLESDATVTHYTAHPLRDNTNAHFLIERHFLNIYKYIAWVAGRHLQLRGAAFRIGPPSWMDDYRQLFHCDLDFNQPQDRLCFSTGDLLAAPVRLEYDLPPMLAGAPQSFWVQPPNTRSFVAQVRRVLFESVGEGTVDFDAIAAQLHMSPVTLRRRLKKEGVSFQEIKDRIRRDKAIALMHDASKTIGDIAVELGYSEPSAFYRAFRHWLGATPSQYRATLAQRQRDTGAPTVVAGATGQRASA